MWVSPVAHHDAARRSAASKTFGGTWSLAAGIALSVILPLTAAAADFGSVVPIGGHASDIALDERRGVVYVANFAMDRVDVLSTADHSWVRSLPFNSSPAALAISANDRYLLVARFGGETDEEDEQPERGNGVTIFDFDAGIRRDIELPSPALTVAFGADDFAIVVTTTEIFRLEVLTGALESLGTIGELANAELERLATEKIPVPFATFPAEITKAAAAASGDHLSIYGFCQAGNTSEVFFFLYDIRTQVLRALLFTSSPDLGPRVTSVNQDGSLALLGWALLTREGILLAQFRKAVLILGGTPSIPGAMSFMLKSRPWRQKAAKTHPVAAAMPRPGRRSQCSRFGTRTTSRFGNGCASPRALPAGWCWTRRARHCTPRPRADS